MPEQPEDHDLDQRRDAGATTAPSMGGQLRRVMSSRDATDYPDQPVQAEERRDGRRVSSLEEIRDGGYGVGSAAPIEDGAMPYDHEIKAWEDTKTFLAPGERGYAGVDPDVWFYDERSAQRSGFRHAD